MFFVGNENEKRRRMGELLCIIVVLEKKNLEFCFFFQYYKNFCYFKLVCMNMYDFKNLIKILCSFVYWQN